MKKILIVTYGGGHVNIINQILLKSKTIKSFEIHIITLTSAKNKIINQDHKIYNLIDFKKIFSSKENLKINYYGNILLNENHNPESAISIEESVFYLGTSMYDLVIKKEIGLNNNTKVITFATLPYVEYDKNYKIIKYEKINPYNEEIIEILKKFISLNYKIILKTHPVSDLSSNYKKFVDNKNIFLIDNKKHDICDVLSISDCLISFNSTTLLEAVLCGKSAVSFNYKEENIYNVSAYKEKPFFHAPSLDFLYENIKSSLKTQNGYDEDFYTHNFHSNFDNLIKKFLE